MFAAIFDPPMTNRELFSPHSPAFPALFSHFRPTFPRKTAPLRPSSFQNFSEKCGNTHFYEMRA